MSTTQVNAANPATLHEAVASAPPDFARTLQSMFDPFGMYASIFQSQQAWAQHPQEWLHAMDRLAREMGALDVHGLRRAHWVGDWKGETDGKQWRGQHRQVPGSWWQDWTRWLAQHCGPLQAPPPTETKEYPALAPAPGTYVLEH